jgi:ATP-dependent helicase HrpA
MPPRTPADLERRRAQLPRPTFPDELPVSQKRADIARAIADHPVVIVCGETGSGKTTQLPKICLELGRGVAGLIGHTQPRRIAARTVATRIAQELKTELGRAVGYKVRFTDKVSADTYVKLMTDGILLAETQGDPDLRAYDTLIIDEAHERSLNIDFLLGYLKRVLARRPDLKVIVTSATIDAARFANHFAHDGTPAPVIEVSGRMYPVEVRYRPLKVADEDEEDEDLEDAIVDAVDEAARAVDGDVLVFLPGEREIRDTAEALRKHHPKGAEILPLFARLSVAEQERVFKPSGARRIVLATNVAETSLTVPGIRSVVDAGLARINRYSVRNKVEQLLVEKIARASANQRAGRCGRLGPGVCIRLYAEEDYAARPEYGEPEILRSSLAAVILRMKALKIGEVEDFPFVEPPLPRAIADGYQQLAELGAVDDRNRLTPIGWELAKLPLDPRIGRMIVAAKRESCLAEVLIIASALEVQDPRDRPFERAKAADEAHLHFADERSDFMAFLNIWSFFADATKNKQSNRALTELLHAKFLSHRRLREWRDVHRQLHAQVTEMGLKPNEKPATYEQIHRALLAGLLGNIGTKNEADDQYLGARGIKFAVFPGSGLKKARPKWVMAAELAETTRLYARCVAKIEPQWIEPLATALVTRQYFDPHWEKERAMVSAWERVALYGLTIVPRRPVHYGAINVKESREIFLRQALVAGEYETRAVFFAHNRRLVKEVEALEAKARKRDVLVSEEAIYAFYDERVPADIVNGAGFEAWRTEIERTEPERLLLTREYLMRHAASDITEVQYPDALELGGVRLKLTYRFEPGHPVDGVTVTLPLPVLNQAPEAAFDWLVPGMIRDKVSALVKALPKAFRRVIVSPADTVTQFLQWVDRRAVAGGPEPGLPLAQALSRYLREELGADAPPDAFDPAALPVHLRMNFRVIDEQGRELAQGRDLAVLRRDLGQAASLAYEEAAPEIEKSGMTAWDCGELPETITFTRAGRKLTGWPALNDDGNSVSVRLFDTPESAARAMRAGVRRLLALAMKEQVRNLERKLPGFDQSALQLRTVATGDDLRDDLVTAVLDRAFIGEDEPPRNDKQFEAQKVRARARLPAVAEAAARSFTAIAQEYQRTSLALSAAKGALNRPAGEIRAQLQRLIFKGFLQATPWEQWPHLPRYLKAMQVRLTKYPTNPERDQKNAAGIAELVALYEARADADRKAGRHDAGLEDFRWQLEELRVSLFAQELRTPYPVSIKRLRKLWDGLR